MFFSELQTVDNFFFQKEETNHSFIEKSSDLYHNDTEHLMYFHFFEGISLFFNP
jgi:hypothetical protein